MQCSDSRPTGINRATRFLNRLRAVLDLYEALTAKSPWKIIAHSCRFLRLIDSRQRLHLLSPAKRVAGLGTHSTQSTLDCAELQRIIQQLQIDKRNLASENLSLFHRARLAEDWLRARDRAVAEKNRANPDGLLHLA